MRRNYTRSRRPVRRVITETEDELQQVRHLRNLAEQLDEIADEVEQDLLDEEDEDDEEEDVIDDDVDDEEEGDDDAIYEELHRRSNPEHDLNDEEVLVD